ncbi:type VI secretion system tube protein Hcp [Roseomonas sp. HF4]|uniref:Hcp family type VI secretion system effector n=1 Tax=Roseomonas sp. HF4 TaxID=2562313 RepID=UPI0010BF77C8|nr:type VI secretion system tube protein Hcp [Roseomonas sp. HF4]
MPIFMKYDGIEGEATTTGFEKQIEMTSFQFGVGRGISSAYGQSTRESSIASVSEITMTKPTDGSSTKLFVAALTGELNKKVTISMVRTSAGSVQPYMVYELEGTGISGYSLSSGGDRPSESLSLNFDKISFKYLLVGDDLNQSPEVVGYDLSKGDTF